jgi:hypothetical protein
MWETIAENCALVINMYHAGWNMIPSLGWRQAVEAWAADVVEK